MSVLIKGMKMQKPKLTDMISVYNAYVLVSPNGHAAIVVDNEDGLDSTEYPLVEVPESHGRLIDADALAHDLDYDVENDQRALDEMDFVGKERESVQFDKDCKQNCMWYLSNAPTIIPASEEGE